LHGRKQTVGRRYTRRNVSYLLSESEYCIILQGYSEMRGYWQGEVVIRTNNSEQLPLSLPFISKRKKLIHRVIIRPIHDPVSKKLKLILYNKYQITFLTIVMCGFILKSNCRWVNLHHFSYLAWRIGNFVFLLSYL
jgi:hypothetical protein